MFQMFQTGTANYWVGISPAYNIAVIPFAIDRQKFVNFHFFQDKEGCPNCSSVAAHSSKPAFRARDNEWPGRRILWIKNRSTPLWWGIFLYLVKDVGIKVNLKEVYYALLICDRTSTYNKHLRITKLMLWLKSNCPVLLDLLGTYIVFQS